MAESQVTQTGVSELRALYERLPERFMSVASSVARKTALAMQAEARRRFENPEPPVRAPHLTGATEALIVVAEDAANRAFLVESRAPAKYPANEVLWREFGTIKELARPYMYPAAQAVRATYESDMKDAMDALAAELSS